MKWIGTLTAIVLFSGCAHLGFSSSSGAGDSEEAWDAAHAALALGDYELATDLFADLADRYGDTAEGRESLFYLGAVHLDPRNPGWDPGPAEEALIRYIALDSLSSTRIYRRPEAETLFQLARQLNMPPEERIAGFQPEPRIVEVERVVTRGTETASLQTEVQRLRELVASRDTTIERQRAELERIRRTLRGGGERDTSEVHPVPNMRTRAP